MAGSSFSAAFDVGPRQLEPGVFAFVVGHGGAQLGNLVVDRFDGVLEFEAVAARLRDDGAHLVLGGQQVGLRDFDGGLLQIALHFVRLLVELDDEIASVDTIVVVDQHACDLPGDARGDERDVAVDVGIVGRDGFERAAKNGDAEVGDDTQQREADGESNWPATRGVRFR